ncbi:MAG: CusA/CzcA family heavy metal efflux RND transporter [Candidatus Binatia bacterium]|nr:CusA/CzcA family heavy metal efflux RND transporter [Candidatus Binatia bacterium]
MLNALIRWSLQQRVVVLVLAVIGVVFGLRALQTLPIDAFPDVTNVQVQVATEVPGRSPDEVERMATIPVEITMTGLPGLVEMRSQNEPGLSIVTLVFTDDTPVYFARQLVAERLAEAKARMPQGLSPVLGPVSTALSEVYQYTLERPDDGTRPLTKEELLERRTIQDWVVRPLLRSVPGVAEINSTGGYVKQYQVLVDPFRLRLYGVSIADVQEALARNNANSSGGLLPRGPEILLVGGFALIRHIDEIRSIVLKEVGGTPVFIRDVAEVRVGEEVRYGAMVKGGVGEAVGGIVMMVAGGNAKEVVSAIKQRVEEINRKQLLPNGLQIVPYYDRSKLVDAALATVSRVLVEGIVLVVVVLFLYLGDVRSSLIVIATLLVTPAVTFLLMNYLGMSANLMSLGGLAIAIGLMIDGSVVVVENVFSRLSHSAPGNRLHVVREAASEVGVPVTFGVGVIILVFLPLMTLQGMEGKLFAPLAYTIALALAVSLVLSLTLSPVLCAYFLRGGQEHDTRLVRSLKRPYTWLLLRAVSQPGYTLAAAAALFTLALLLFPYLGTSFIPELKEGTISPNINRAPNIALDESIQMELEAQRLVKDIPGVDYVVSRLGRGESPIDPAGYNETDMMIELLPPAKRGGRTQDEIADEVRRRLAVLPGVNIVMAQPISDRVDEMVTGVRADIAVKIFGEDLDILLEKANEVVRVANTIRGTGEIKVDRVGGQHTLRIVVDRQAIARHGLDAADVHDIIEAAVGGRGVTEIYEGERRFQVVVRYPEHLRNSVAAISNITVTGPQGEPIPLSAVARVEVQEGLSQVRREQGRRRIAVAINVRDRDLGGYVSELQREVERRVSLPSGYFFEWGGQFENMQRARAHLAVIVPVTIGAIFFLLFLLFRSVRLAALIILVLPFASIGGVVGLFVTGEYLSVPASIGFIALWGIAVLNGVVLVSYIRTLRQQGLQVAAAVVEGAQRRFRPVMMTATVAALGLVPFLFATGVGAEVQRPLAVVVISGLVSSTVLTLVVLPALYRFFDVAPQEQSAVE